MLLIISFKTPVASEVAIVGVFFLLFWSVEAATHSLFLTRFLNLIPTRFLTHFPTCFSTQFPTRFPTSFPKKDLRQDSFFDLFFDLENESFLRRVSISIMPCSLFLPVFSSYIICECVRSLYKWREYHSTGGLCSLHLILL